MDRTRRICLVAAGVGVGALLLFRNGATVLSAAAPGDAVTVVRGADAARPAAQAAVDVAPEVAAWQAQLGQPVALSGGGARLEARIAVVDVSPRPAPAVAAPVTSRWWGWLTGSRSVPAAAAATVATAATLPAGVRPYAFRVLVAIESGPAPTVDMLMDMDRSIEGLRQLFVQPAMPVAGKAMVAAWFG